MKNIKVKNTDLHMKKGETEILLIDHNNKTKKNLILDAIMYLIESLDESCYQLPETNPEEYEKDIKKIRRKISENKKYNGIC